MLYIFQIKQQHELQHQLLMRSYHEKQMLLTQQHEQQLQQHIKVRLTK